MHSFGTEIDAQACNVSYAYSVHCLVCSVQFEAYTIQETLYHVYFRGIGLSVQRYEGSVQTNKLVSPCLLPDTPYCSQQEQST